MKTVGVKKNKKKEAKETPSKWKIINLQIETILIKKKYNDKTTCIDLHPTPWFSKSNRIIQPSLNSVRHIKLLTSNRYQPI